ncbi:MAG: SOS response-associated peptidase [Planctomycetota bacterium]|jgi:putative SOS response-associated peptidase YedK
MCGRYSLEARSSEIVEAFGLAEAISIPARYNIAPTQSVPIVRIDAETSDRRLQVVRWGLTPAWAKGPRPIINARSETIAQKPSFRSSFKRRRCLVPATGFYEWQKVGSAKQPFCIRQRGGGVFAFAGIWDQCRDEDGNPAEAFAILTCAPNRTMEPIHNRMPVILEVAAYARWLDPQVQSPEPLADLLAPAPDERLTAYPVSSRVNSPAHDDAECIEPLAG